jgi:hypothetical protein
MSTRVGVAVFIVDSKKILIGKRVLDNGVWALAGGKMDFGEVFSYFIFQLIFINSLILLLFLMWSPEEQLDQRNKEEVVFIILSSSFFHHHSFIIILSSSFFHHHSFILMILDPRRNSHQRNKRRNWS